MMFRAVAPSGGSERRVGSPRSVNRRLRDGERRRMTMYLRGYRQRVKYTIRAATAVLTRHRRRRRCWERSGTACGCRGELLAVPRCCRQCGRYDVEPLRVRESRC